MARILVVEDEAVLRLTFGQFLEEEGHQVSVAEDYTQAAKLLEKPDFDVIVERHHQFSLSTKARHGSTFGHSDQ